MGIVIKSLFILSFFGLLHRIKKSKFFVTLCIVQDVCERWLFKNDTMVLIQNHFQAGSDSAKSLRGGHHNLDAELLRDGGAE
jgi:hypothetical protein